MSPWESENVWACVHLMEKPGHTGHVLSHKHDLYCCGESPQGAKERQTVPFKQWSGTKQIGGERGKEDSRLRTGAQDSYCYGFNTDDTTQTPVELLRLDSSMQLSLGT